MELTENIAHLIKHVYAIKDGLELNVKLNNALMIVEEMDNVIMEHVYVLMAF